MMLATGCCIWTLGSHLLTTDSHRKKNKMRAFCNLNMHSFLSSKVLCVLSQQHLASFGIVYHRFVLAKFYNRTHKIAHAIYQRQAVHAVQPCLDTCG